MTDAERYLKHIELIMSPRPEFKFSSYESLVLNQGREFSEVFMADEKGEIKECFMNALHFALENDYLYVEGYAMSIIPVQHAWVVDYDGVCLETTWPEIGEWYYGVALDPMYANRIMASTGYYGLFGNDYLNKADLLRNGFPVEELQIGLLESGV